jgi:hypothetical protein
MALNLDPDRIVNELHPNPDSLESVVTLEGYLGPSSTQGNVRLYLDLTFNNYYEIPNAKDAIVGRTRKDPVDESSQTILRVRSQTRLQVVSISSKNVEAGYLSGAITSGFLGTSQSQGALSAVGGLQGITDCSLCTGLVCLTVSLAFCAQGQARGGIGPQGITDCSVCTTIVCGTISLAFCAQGRGGAGVQGITDCSLCTGLPCLTVSLAFCAQGQARGGIGPQTATFPGLCTVTVLPHTICCAQGLGGAAASDRPSGAAGGQARDSWTLMWCPPTNPFWCPTTIVCAPPGQR